MFWKFNILTSSHIDSLLDKEEVTLKELMDEDDILQECKAQNKKLIDFLIQPQHMEEMVNLITTEPTDELDEKVRFKYPNTACELLTSDVSQINDKLANEEELVNKLYAFLEGDKPLNPLLASFFSKVMGLLITRKSEMIFEYLKLKNDFVGSLLHHIGTSAVMDLLLRLITCIESTVTRRAVIEWLNEEKIVEKLVDSIVTLKDEEIHCNAAQSLCDIVRLGREQFNQQQDTADPDPLLVTMEQEETVAQLLSNMFDSKNDESVLINGLCVIHTLLEVRKGTETSDMMPNCGENDRIIQGINNVIAAIIPRLKDFHDLLVNPPKQHYSTMPSSMGSLDPPLGNTRLQVAKLITALVGANMHQVNTELASLGTIQTLLDLCFQYVWNNFLHTQIEQCLLIILNNGPITIDGKPEHPLLTQLFTEYKFVERLLQEWETNDTEQAAPKGRRKGFMGHLNKMANSISSLLEKEETSTLIKEHFNDLPEETKERWKTFSEGSLADLNKRNTIELMRSHPLVSSSEDDDSDFKDIPFPQDTAMQQAYSDYQLQQMTSNFIDQFGFNDEEFAEQDEKIDAAFSERISSIDADIQVHDAKQSSAALFDQLCNERIQQFDNDDSDEDIWEEKHITFDKNVQHCRSERLQGQVAECHSSDEDSTDSGDELYSPVKIKQSSELFSSNARQSSEGMEVDNSENPWSGELADSSSQAEPVAMDTTSPWDKAPKTNGPTDNWADFGSVPTQSDDNWADFTTFEGENGPRSSSPVAMDTAEQTSRSNAYVVFDSVPGESTEAEASPAPSSDSRMSNLEAAEDADQLPDSTSLTPSSESPTSPAHQSPQQPSLPTSSPPPLPVSSPPLNGSSVDAQVTSSSESIESGSAVDAEIVSTSSSTELNEDSSSHLPSVSTSSLGTSDGLENSSLQDSQDESFLAKSGLLRKGPASAAAPGPSDAPQDNGPVASPPSPSPGALAPCTTLPMTDGDASLPSTNPDTSAATEMTGDSDTDSLTQSQKLELARAQAKEAQELFDSATVVGNGPV